MPLFPEVAHVTTSNKAKHDTSQVPFNDLTAALAAFDAKKDMQSEHVNKSVIKQTFNPSSLEID